MGHFQNILYLNVDIHILSSTINCQSPCEIVQHIVCLVGEKMLLMWLTGLGLRVKIQNWVPGCFFRTSPFSLSYNSGGCQVVY